MRDLEQISKFIDENGFYFCSNDEQLGNCEHLTSLSLLVRVSDILGERGERYYVRSGPKNENQLPFTLYNMLNHISKRIEIGDYVMVNMTINTTHHYGLCRLTGIFEKGFEVNPVGTDALVIVDKVQSLPHVYGKGVR